MKRLRNVGIYYTLFGIGLLLSFVYALLWPISLLGIALFLLFLILRFGFKKKRFPIKITEVQLRYWDLFLIAFPFFYVGLINWYVSRPYRQTVILPAGYEGVVAVQFDKPNGQAKNWTGGFLGICASRSIKVDSTGVAETQFKFINYSIPWLGLEQVEYNNGGLKIYYENDLRHEIVPGADGSCYNTYEHEVKGAPNIYFAGFRSYPLFIFVVTKPENYFKYFMTEKEKTVWLAQQKKDASPYTYMEVSENELNANYDSFYRFKDFYYDKLR